MRFAGSEGAPDRRTVSVDCHMNIPAQFSVARRLDRGLPFGVMADGPHILKTLL
jgi:hypothetical protein